jgi:Fe-S oxidoreductase
MITWQTPLFMLVAGGALGYSARKFRDLFRLAKSLKGQAKRTDRLPDRIWTTVLNVLGQKAVMERQPIGVAHFFIFWGFLIISLGTLEQFLSTLLKGVNFEFLGPLLYPAFVLSQDFFTSTVLLAVLYATWRRAVRRPKELSQSRDANLVLLFTGSLMVSIFLMNAFLILGEAPYFAPYMPVSNTLASFFRPLELEAHTFMHVSTFFKWVHMCIVLGFAMYIPSSKHLHVIAAGPNTFLKTLDRPKGMRTLNFDDPNAAQFGSAKITDFSWKDALDLYSCTECGRCESLCPAWNTQKPLSPKKLIIDMKHNLFEHKTSILGRKEELVGSILDGHVSEDVIWACTSCRACEIACPVFIEHTDKIYDVRRNLVMMESKFPTEVQAVFKNMETNASPWAFPPSDRANWAQGLNVPLMSETQDVEVLFWVGCAGSYDDRNKKVATAVVNLLKKAGITFAILGPEEQCTGDPARRMGHEYLYQTLAKANIETLNRYKPKKIVTACPHCFNSIKNEYPDLGGTYEVIHHSELLQSLLAEKKLRPEKEFNEAVTFHDSCYLGRWNNIYGAPRAILESIPRVDLKEMSSNHDKSLCCGAGGGRMWMEEHIGDRINVKRTEQALATKATTVAASCPFCITMLSDGLKTKEAEGQVKVLDVSELLDQVT